MSVQDRRGPLYFDAHATTPCAPEVVEAMLPYFTERFGNASSRAHRFGTEAKGAVDVARARVAALIGADPAEIVWTSGATEANNLAILGVAAAYDRPGHLVVSAIEHHAVLDPAEALERRGWRVTRVAPTPDGLLDPAAFEAAFQPDTRLCSVMLANNEVGTIQPVAAIAAAARARGIWVHTDAVQAPGRTPIDVRALGVDLLSLSAHKLYGPKGTGALYARRGRPKLPIEPIFFGGGHERGLRSGTLPVPLLVGFGVAAELAARDLADGLPTRLAALRDALWFGLEADVPGIALNGSLASRLPNNLNVRIPGVEAAALLMALREDVALSTGSACSSASLAPSHVLRAMGIADEDAHASLRFGLLRDTTPDEVAAVVGAVRAKVALVRALTAESGGP